MEERFYGGNKKSYGAKKVGGGFIELRIYHSNKQVLVLLERHRENPSWFLKRKRTYARPDTRAKFWLAKVMDDFPGEFERNEVKIVI